MIDNLEREIISIQQINMDFLKKHVMPLGINWIHGHFNINDSTMYLSLTLKDQNHIHYTLEKTDENGVDTTLEEKEIQLSQVTRVIKSFYNAGNQIPNSKLEISFEEVTNSNWGDKRWFVIYGDTVKPTLHAHSYKAPAKKSMKKFPKLNVRAMF